MSNFLQDLFVSYKVWVSANPQFVSDVETTVKWVSYFVAGRITNSSILSELIYSLSNILVLFNDRIIENSYSNGLTRERGYKLKLMLTTLEYCEVFIEISTRKLWGEEGRWIFVVAVQIFKCFGRFLLTRYYNEEIIKVPSVPALDRKEIMENKIIDVTGDAFQKNNCFSFKLKRSGRIFRKIEGAPPVYLRNWKPLKDDFATDTKLSDRFIIKMAESLYISRPLIHLGAIGLFGFKTWRSFSCSLIFDLVSIRLYYNNRHLLSKQQKIELSRRCINLLLYFVRSPFYEKASQKHINKILSWIGKNIPLAKAVCNPLVEYIPIWQQTYFYLWSS